jgi:hypothetical protein
MFIASLLRLIDVHKQSIELMHRIGVLQAYAIMPGISFLCLFIKPAHIATLQSVLAPFTKTHSPSVGRKERSTEYPSPAEHVTSRLVVTRCKGND